MTSCHGRFLAHYCFAWLEFQYLVLNRWAIAKSDRQAPSKTKLQTQTWALANIQLLERPTLSRREPFYKKKNYWQGGPKTAFNYRRDPPPLLRLPKQVPFMKKLLPNRANSIQLPERATNKLSRLPSNDKWCLLRPSITFLFLMSRFPLRTFYNKQPPAKAKKHK